MFLEILREQTAASPERQRAALAGLSAYQQAKRGRTRRMAAIRHRQRRARLRQYGTVGAGRPVVFVPSLINPPFILDLARGQSLLRWLASEGFNPFLLDWGNPAPADRDMDLTAHVERLLLPLLRRFATPPVLVGYCLGGTLATAAAAAMPVAGLATIASPWRFARFPAIGRHEIAALWENARPLCEAMGLVPMEVLQSGFWRLDPRRTIAKFEAFAALPPQSEEARRFVALEDWANAGAPLTWGAGRQMFEDFFAADLPGQGEWRVGGRTVDPLALDCPTVDFVSTTDRIVPAATASGIGDRRALSAGHVGMVVGSRSKAELWTPLADWISGIDGTR